MKTEHRKSHFELWWLKPSWVFGGTAAIVAGLAAVVPAEVFEQRWKTPKYFNSALLLYVMASIAAFLFGTFLMDRHASRSAPPIRSDAAWQNNIDWEKALLFFRLSCLLCFVGYVAWAYSAVSSGISARLLLGALTGAKGATYELRDSYLTRISGVTTMTQFGIAAVVLGVPIGFARGWKKVLAPMILIGFLATVRALINSERLAIIELIVPALICSVHLWSSKRARPRRWLSLMPLVNGVAVISLFTLFEYFRSWVTFYSGQKTSLWGFAADRLLGYYATALNNSAYLWHSLDVPLGAPYFTLGFLWRFPVISDFVGEIFHGLALRGPEHYMFLLANGANPEFNNTGGILLPLLDFGLGFGLLYWIAFGIIIQYLYRGFLAKTPVGLCFYPAVFTGLLEISRIFYWSDGRFFPAGCMLCLSALAITVRPVSRPFIWAGANLGT